MTEREEADKLAERLLDEPNADPDDELRILSRQLLRRNEVINKLKAHLNDALDPTRDMIHANVEIVLDKYKEATRRIEKILRRFSPITVYGLIENSSKIDLALRVIQAVNIFHPMHGERWCGWPEDTE